MITVLGILRHDRFQQIDYLQPFYFEPAVILIPLPVSSANAAAVAKPFQTLVLLHHHQ